MGECVRGLSTSTTPALLFVHSVRVIAVEHVSRQHNVFATAVLTAAGVSRSAAPLRNVFHENYGIHPQQVQEKQTPKVVVCLQSKCH